VKVQEKIAALRKSMSEKGLRAYIVPSADPHQSEYVANCYKRRAFISGFDGSAGTVVVTDELAGLWTDSRYFVQAAQQLAGSGIDLFKQGEPETPEIEEWLGKVLEKGARVGADPMVFSASEFEKLAGKLEGSGIEVVGMESDLVDRVWGAEKPALPEGELRVHPVEFAGREAGDKVASLDKEIKEAGADFHVLCALDEIAWLFNLRGSDVAYNPVFISYAVVGKGKATLYVDPSKVTQDVKQTLGAEIECRPYDQFGTDLEALGKQGAGVWIDPDRCSRWVWERLSSSGATVMQKTGPVPQWKAAKNGAEIAGMKAAHLRDGVAMVKLLHFILKNVAGGELDEMAVVEKARQFRGESGKFIGSSFATISAYGAHGAIVHYAVSPESNVGLEPEGILLIDSGGQYTDGTTDITRTLALGRPSDEQKRAYTAVLKGHLGLTRQLFPWGTDGYQLDVVARAPLWNSGLNYGHGTGHGVGAALCVHEGPFSVSLRKVLHALVAGNILSIEPGFYKEGAYGIRIENLARVVEREDGFLGFETLTLCPYARDLIDSGMLDEIECRQVDAYHARVFEALSGRLEEAERDWLRAQTRPL